MLDGALQPTPKGDWTEAEEAHLRKRWADGASGAAIAAELPGRTRNSVISKADRLGLPEHTNCRNRHGRDNRGVAATGGKRAQFGDLRPRAIGERRESEAPKPVRIDQAPIGKPVSMMDAEPHHCRWPLGDIAGTFHFCGQRKVAGSRWPYCEHHRRRASSSPGILRRKQRACERALLEHA